MPLYTFVGHVADGNFGGPLLVASSRRFNPGVLPLQGLCAGPLFGAARCLLRLPLLLLETDPFVAAVLTDGIDVISVAHLGRSQTYHHWALVEGKGKRAMVPPDPPDPPKNKHKNKPPHDP